MEEKYLRKGSLIAIVIGFPFGLIFTLFCSYESLFPPLTQLVYISDGGHFWRDWPIIIPLFLALFGFLLWHAGRRSVKSILYKKYGIVRRSINTSIFINTILFSTMILYCLIAIWLGSFNGDGGIYLGIFFLLVMYFGVTIFSAFSICMLINYIIESKIDPTNIVS